jgi:triacylglycerol lipase
MVARITRLLLLLQISVVVVFTFAIETLQITNFPLAVILSIGIVLGLRMAITANNFFISHRYRSDTSTRLNWHEGLRLFLKEFSASMLSSSWTMAFFCFGKWCADNPATQPVLLIHGYGCNSGYWHALSKALKKAQITHHAVDLEPVLGDIDGYIPVIHRAVEAICKETGHDKIIVVAHSMGGLAARAYIREHGSRRIAKVITLGTPHRGTGLANFGIGQNSKQMCWTGNAEKGTPSNWLRALEQTETAATRALFISIYSHHDNIVSPQSSSCLAGAVNIGFHGIGHVALALNPAVQACVLDAILNIQKIPRSGESTQTASNDIYGTNIR